MSHVRMPLSLPLILAAVCSSAACADEPTQFGFSKLDVTPREPVRLSGYGNRAKPFEGVTQKLWVRSMALRPHNGETHALVSVDTIGLPGALTESIARRLDQQYGISREQFVLCGTHSHTAPHLEGGLVNLFEVPLSSDEQDKTSEYTEWLADQIVEGVGKAIDNFAPGRLQRGKGSVGFAANRRVLVGGRWKQFGVTPGAPVDHSLPVLTVTGLDGQLRGVVFNYACHCTTLTGSYNQVNGDWAGYASQNIEEANPSAVALCTIGCGGDANPEPRGELQMAQAHGRAAALAVQRVIGGPMTDIRGDLVCSYGYAGLGIDTLSRSEIRKQTEDKRAVVRRRAEHLQDVLKRMGRLQESYPMPLQTWQFGDELTMVFLGGEVVVDYAHRLKREIKSDSVWVTAYANDVFGYVASERVRQEGGYEVDFSTVYYNLAGPWLEGTEDLIVRRVKEILAAPQMEGSLSAEESRQAFQLPPGFEIELVAAEPLIADPVNFAFGPDGRLWVVEMGDYPGDIKGKGKPGGTIKFLEDRNQDGKFDRATLFLDKIGLPSGVMPWRNGVLVSAAPEVFYAEDTDGDGRADVRKTLFTGFDEANPQHRVNGFTFGLDNWIYLAGGAPNGDIRSELTGKVVDTTRRDVRIRPDQGLVEAVSGMTQFVRIRDDWGNWFGNENSRPIFHFAVSDRYLRRNRFFRAPNAKVDLMNPPHAPAVFPRSRTVGRFNDLWAANRFTSACSAILFRDKTLGPDMRSSAFICEPVHNLVHRTMVTPDGITFRAERHADEQTSEFLASTDLWSRPVRVATGPDGALWMADMYRHVIEHPQWIPDYWQKKLDLRAGEDMGRIYRIFRKGRRPGPLPDLTSLSNAALVERLDHSNGSQRDTAQRLLVHQRDAASVPLLEKMAINGTNALARIHALCTLDGMDALTAPLLSRALSDSDWRVQRRAILLCEPLLDQHPELGRKLVTMIDHSEIGVRFQLALTLGEWDNDEAAPTLAKLAAHDVENRWMRTAVLSSASRDADRIFADLVRTTQPTPARSRIVQPLIETALGSDPKNRAGHVLQLITSAQEQGVATWQIAALTRFVEALARRNLNFEQLAQSKDDQLGPAIRQAERICNTARRRASDRSVGIVERRIAIGLLGHGLGDRNADMRQLAQLLTVQTPPVLQLAVVRTLSSLNSDDVPSFLLEEWRGHAPNIKDAILIVLLQRPEWTSALLDALESKQIPLADVDAASREQLLGRKEDGLGQRAQQLFSTAESSSRLQIVAEHQSVLGMRGNPFRGAAVFSRRCTTCHRLRARGNEVGPNLAALRDKSSEYLLVALLDPNRAVERKYRGYTAATVDGRVFHGMLLDASSASITLAQPNGSHQIIPRDDIDEFSNSGKSFMPEGLEKDLSQQDMADLFAFIQRQPRAIGTATESSAAEARQQLEEVGMNGLGQIVSAGSKQSRDTFLGKRDMPICESASASQSLRWMSKPAAANGISGQATLFRLPVAMGRPSGSDAKFTLAINGKPLLEFASTNSDAAWTSTDGRITLRYLAVEVGEEETNGLLEVEFLGSLIKAGKPTEFSVTANPASGDGWFGLLPIPAATATK